MTVLFYVAGAIAFVSTLLVITEMNAVHALLYMIVSLLAVALIFFLLGAPFIAALEVIIYAGSIMVLFVFVVMLINLGARDVNQERRWFNPRVWAALSVMSAVLLAELVYALRLSSAQGLLIQTISPVQVSLALFGPYLLGVELASLLLMAGLVGAYQLGWRGH